MSKKIFVPGGTGAMGVYLLPELLKLGYSVDVLSLDDISSDNPSLNYIKGNALDYGYIEELLKNDYDAVVDFMIYPQKELYSKFLPLYLANCEHYIYLSSYRVYANEEHPVKETSPRLYDLPRPEGFVDELEYSIYKAEGEELLKCSGFDNWTIVRPAITYSKRRFQLVTMEMPLVVRRMLEGKRVVLPEPALDVQATMSWAGDVAKMISRLILNKKAYGEAYSVTTAEHNTWSRVAELYEKIGGLKTYVASTEEYLDIILPGSPYAYQQLAYDRYFDRIMDNSKILDIAGMKQSELMPLEKGLAMELVAFPKNFAWWQDDAYDRMDKFLEEKGKLF